MKAIKAGTRVRMTTESLLGWKGTGTVMRVHGDNLTILKDGFTERPGGDCVARRDQVRVMHDQTPNAEHGAALIWEVF